MVMMSRSVRVLVVCGLWLGGCAHDEAPTADPEALQLDPPVVIVDDPPPEPEAEPAELAGPPPATLAADPSTEVITFVGEDADPGPADEITAPPKRAPLPSMMSDVLHGPNK